MESEEDMKRLDDHNNNPHRTYLLTYSRLDHRIFPTRASFGAAAAASFGGNNVDYFVASKESHADNGYHYHCALRLHKSMRWKTSKQFFQQEFGVVVNYAVSSNMYIGAYRYAVKHDRDHAYFGDVLQKHPNLDTLTTSYARALNANNTYCRNIQNNSNDEGAPQKKAKRDDKIKKPHVAHFIIQNNLKTELQLMSAAVERRDLSDSALYEYLISLRGMSRRELLQDAWAFEQAKSRLENETVNCIEKINEKSESECVCQNLWLDCANEILARNNIPRGAFSRALYAAIDQGRGKHVNILIIGPADCGKTFILEPICEVLPGVFQNPANSTCGWLGVQESNAVFLNDFLWSPRQRGGNIEWAELLKLLEGGQVTLPAPMNTNSSNINVVKKMPIFAISSEEIRFWINHPDEPVTDRHKQENEMMKSRWSVFRFSYRFSQDEKIQVPKCSRCFAKLVLQK